MRKKAPSIAVNIFQEKKHWVAQGGRLRVEGPTLQSTRRRIRKAAEEAYGPGVELETSLHLPAVVTDRVERYQQQRAEVEKARAALRRELVDIVDLMRHEFGTSYEDAAAVLGLDAANLLRAVHNSTMTTAKLSSEDDD